MAEKATVSAKKPEHKGIVQALCAAELEFGEIEKSAKGFNYQYATIDLVLAAVKKPLAKHGIWLTQDIITDEDDNCTHVTCFTSIMWGAKEDGSPAVVLKSSGNSSRAKSHDPQDVGTAETYARRYDLFAFLAIHPKDEDDDASSQKGVVRSSKPKPRPNPKPEPVKIPGPISEVPGIGPNLTRKSELAQLEEDFASLFKGDTVWTSQEKGAARKEYILVKGQCVAVNEYSKLRKLLEEKRKTYGERREAKVVEVQDQAEVVSKATELFGNAFSGMDKNLKTFNSLVNTKYEGTDKPVLEDQVGENWRNSFSVAEGSMAQQSVIEQVRDHLSRKQSELEIF